MGKPFKLANGLLLLSTEAPGGIYNSAQLKKIAALCDADSAVVKATEDHRLAIFVASEKAAKVAAELKALGLGVRHYQDGLHQPVNCLGELCSEHQQDAMGASIELATELAGLTLSSPLKIGINGCARSCVATHTLDVSIIGETNGYRISLGGKNSQLPEMASFMAEGVPAAKLPKLIAKVVSVYKELAQKDETLQEVMERAGSKKFIEALAPYSQDAAQEDPFAGLGDSSGGAAPAADDDLKLDDLPSGDDSFQSPEVGRDLGVGTDPGPNFEDDDLGLGFEEETTAAALESNDTDDLALVEDLNMEELTPDAESSLENSPENSPENSDDIDFGEEAPAEELPFEDLATSSLPVEELAMEDDLNLSSDDTTELEEMTFEEPAAPMPKATLAPTPATAPTLAAVADPVGDSDDYLIADEVDEADADAFEEKLNASIAEEESFPEVEDFNSADRIEAMKLVEKAEADDTIDVHEELAIDGSFDNLGIEHDEELMPEGDLEAESMDPGAPGMDSSSTTFDFVGFDLSPEGRISLNFSSGASVAIDPRILKAGSRRELMIGGKRITIAIAAKGLEVEVDGVALFLPKRAA